jgi:hypothetical protein
MRKISEYRSPLLYWIGLFVGAACLAYNVLEYNQTIKIAPRAPDSATGSVVPSNNHGTIIFLTEKQALVERWGPLGWGAWLMKKDRAVTPPN